MIKFPPFVVAAIAAASATALFAACGVKAAPTPMMQGFEPRYQSEVNMRVAQNQSTTNPAGLAPPVQGAGPTASGSAPLAPQSATPQPGSAFNPSTGTVGAALNSPVITPTAAITATPVYTAPPVNNSPSTAPVAPQGSGSMAAPQNGSPRP